MYKKTLEYALIVALAAATGPVGADTHVVLTPGSVTVLQDGTARPTDGGVTIEQRNRHGNRQRLRLGAVDDDAGNGPGEPAPAPAGEDR